MTNLADLNKNMPILIVDDYSTVRRIVKNCLGRLGFKNVIEAEDGESAFEMLKNNEVELVISDWQMPRISGSQLLQSVRTDSRLRPRHRRQKPRQSIGHDFVRRDDAAPQFEPSCSSGSR